MRCYPSNGKIISNGGRIIRTFDFILSLRVLVTYYFQSTFVISPELMIPKLPTDSLLLQIDMAQICLVKLPLNCVPLVLGNKDK